MVEDARVAEYRLTMSRLASGICVVTTRWGKLDHAMTATSVMSVSLEPLLAMFAVHVDSRFRDALDESDKWAISIMGAHGAPDARWLATPGRPVWGQLDQVAHRRGEASGAVLLDRAIGTVECQTHEIFRAGDHDLVVGSVLATSLGPDEPGLVHRGSAFHEVS